MRVFEMMVYCDLLHETRVEAEVELTIVEAGEPWVLALCAESAKKVTALELLKMAMEYGTLARKLEQPPVSKTAQRRLETSSHGPRKVLTKATARVPCVICSVEQAPGQGMSKHIQAKHPEQFSSAAERRAKGLPG